MEWTLRKATLSLAALALLLLCGCSTQGLRSQSSSIPSGPKAGAPPPPLFVGGTLSKLPRAQFAAHANVQLAIPAMLQAHPKPNSTIVAADQEVVGTLVNAGGPYTGMYAQNTAYASSAMPLYYPVGAKFPQELAAPVTFPPGGSCLASGSVALNAGSGVSTYFVVFDLCGKGIGGPALIPIDITFQAKYVTNNAQGLPSYTTIVGTPDRTPTTNSTWYVLLYNNQSATWEVAGHEKGLNAGKFGLSAYVSFYQPGACPSGLPTLVASSVQLFNAGSGQFESIVPAMTGTTTSAENPGASAQCFLPDSSGPAPATATFAMTVPNSAWQVTSRAPSAYSSDDWIEFAHDNLHTGFQPQPTGISASSVPNLALRWKTALPNGGGMYASPLVYNGNVVVVTALTKTVYDLSAADGHVLWSYPVSGFVTATPTIDPATGLLFVSDRIVDKDGVHPSFVYALHLRDGTLAWNAQVNGITHQGPVVAGGAVYQGTSGGDPPECLNGGVTSLNELSGTTNWVWHVNSQVNPRGGGSAWGAIAFDGTRLIFGTGNTCGNMRITTANGVVALDPNGNVLWNFTVEPRSYLDYDTGGGVMISHGAAVFKNKTGILYSVDAASGMLLHETMVDPNFGYGEFPSPSTDGSTTVISYGLNPNGPNLRDSRSSIVARTHRDQEYIEHHKRTRPFDKLQGYHSSLVGVNSSGTVIWAHPMDAMLDGYAAIANGVVFSDDDSALSAFDIRNGSRLWSYPFPSLPAASPAVVPSGVYAADASGNVYAFALSHP